MALVLLLATSILVVIPGEVDAIVPGGIGRIAFVSDVDEIQGEIYVRDFAGSSPVRLTNNTVPDSTPLWSADGTRLAFTRSGAGFGSDVFVMDPDGSNVVNLTSGSAATNFASDWSPDGTQILFSSDRTGNHELWIMYADGSSPHQLTTNPGWEYGATWSPDGSTIAFGRDEGLTSDLWLMDSDGSNERNLTSDPGRYGPPAWSPDGTNIVFSNQPVSDRDIWVIGADGSNRANLTNAAGPYDFAPAWSPDGSKIAFSSDRDGDFDLWTMDPDGTNLAHLTNSPGDEHSVTWEPVNRVPQPTDDEAVTHRGHSVVVEPLSNDYDPDGDALTLGDITRMPDEGSVAIDPSGTVTYTHNGTTVPPNHVMPYTDSFEYRVDDTRQGSGFGTVQVWIYPYFDDVPESNVFFDNVVWLAVQRITQGCNPPDNTLFCPTEFVTRGQMAAFLVRARGFSDGAGADLFVDDNGSVFELDIDRLGTAGVTKGCNPPINDRYCPGKYVTRGQMAAFLVRAFALTDLGLHDLFVDDNESIFEADIDKLGANRVSLGCNPPANDRFCPNDYVTRQQMAAFISRAVTTGQE
jgi:Tol biopolymer transport system component